MNITNQTIFSEFIEFLQNLTPEQWMTKVTDKWTVKDVISHLIGWNIDASSELKNMWETGRDVWFLTRENYGEFNEKYVTLFEKLTPGEVLKKWVESEDEFNKIVGQIGEENLRKDNEKYYWVFDEGEDNHYLEHLNQLKKAISESRNL